MSSMKRRNHTCLLSPIFLRSSSSCEHALSRSFLSSSISISICKVRSIRSITRLYSVNPKKLKKLNSAVAGGGHHRILWSPPAEDDVDHPEPSLARSTALISYPFASSNATTRIGEVRHSLWEAYYREYVSDVTPSLCPGFENPVNLLSPGRITLMQCLHASSARFLHSKIANKIVLESIDCLYYRETCFPQIGIDLLYLRSKQRC